MKTQNNISVPKGYWISKTTGGLCHESNGIVHDTNLWFAVGHAPLDGVKKTIVKSVLSIKNTLVNLVKVEAHHYPENHPKHCTAHHKVGQEAQA